ncbi:MAG: Ni-sirohydrochlorin a,c-diamide reductive cyclase catalytic subunit [Methermicoccaceae archaeon]
MAIDILHPRPSSIVAALYTLRDLDVDVVVLHGPPGCSFKHARLLEEDGVRVLTTALDDTSFIFGGAERLKEVLQLCRERFKPHAIGVVGTCASMIIGEDMQAAVREAGLDVPVVVVNVHAGYPDNTTGVMLTLESARDAGLISDEEVERQRILMQKATEIEKEHGAASSEYIAPSRGDLKHEVAARLLELARKKRRGVVVLNAKKETAYSFADVMLALNEMASKMHATLVNIANMSTEVGLPRIRGYSLDITRELEMHGFCVHELTGGLDEYAVAGIEASRIIRERYSEYDYAVVCGVPHALDVEAMEGMELFAVTNGPRQVEALREMGYEHVVVELDLHPRTLGVNHIVESELGENIRALLAR